MNGRDKSLHSLVLHNCLISTFFVAFDAFFIVIPEICCNFVTL